MSPDLRVWRGLACMQKRLHEWRQTWVDVSLLRLASVPCGYYTTRKQRNRNLHTQNQKTITWGQYRCRAAKRLNSSCLHPPSVAASRARPFVFSRSPNTHASSPSAPRKELSCASRLERQKSQLLSRCYGRIALLRCCPFL